MSQILISAIDIRPDKVICLIAQELQIANQGNILQLIGTAVIPILIFIYVSTLHDSILWIGILSIIVMTFSYLFRNKGIRLKEITKQIKKHLKNTKSN